MSLDMFVWFVTDSNEGYDESIAWDYLCVQMNDQVNVGTWISAWATLQVHLDTAICDGFRFCLFSLTDILQKCALTRCSLVFQTVWPWPWLWSGGSTSDRSRREVWPALWGPLIRDACDPRHWRTPPTASPSRLGAFDQNEWLGKKQTNRQLKTPNSQIRHAGASRVCRDLVWEFVFSMLAPVITTASNRPPWR